MRAPDWRRMSKRMYVASRNRHRNQLQFSILEAGPASQGARGFVEVKHQPALMGTTALNSPSRHRQLGAYNGFRYVGQITGIWPQGFVYDAEFSNLGGSHHVFQGNR